MLIDLYGGMHALSRLIDDKAGRTKDLRALLGKDCPVESMPSVEEAKQLVAGHRRIIERSSKEDCAADRLAELRQAQQERRGAVEREREALRNRHHDMRRSRQASHRVERDGLRAQHLATIKAIRMERYRSRPTGLAVFLGKVSGVAPIREKVQRYQDSRRLRAYLTARASLKAQQVQEQKVLDLRLKLQIQEIERKAKALDRDGARGARRSGSSARLAFSTNHPTGWGDSAAPPPQFALLSRNRERG